MIQQPQFNELGSFNLMEIGTQVNIPEILDVNPEKFLSNATNIPSEILVNSLIRSLISLGGVEFLTNIFQKNTYLILRMSTKKDKIFLGKAIEKFLSFSENLNLRLLLFYLEFYIRAGGIDQETLTVVTPNFVLTFDDWRNTLTSDEVEQIQVPGELWEGLDAIGVRIKSPDKEKLGRSRNRAIALFSEDSNTQSDESI